MARRKQSPKKSRRKSIEALLHDDATRKNIPTAEYQSIMQQDEQKPIEVAYAQRDVDLDPQLIWRGKGLQDGADLITQAPPLYVQEKVHPKVLIDDLLKQSQAGEEPTGVQIDLFADFNGLPDDNAKTEFYQHEANWTNRMILGDGLQVMASLAERESLRGKVQCIYIDPPYGIKFNSNFQWSTTTRDVQDGKAEHITREPECVRAFRDTWKDGVHSYLTYLRDRLTAARDLLAESGSVFVQIGPANVHRVRVLMDEVFGEDNCVGFITYRSSSGTTRERAVKSVTNFLLWYGKNSQTTKFRRLLKERAINTKMYNQVEESVGRKRTMTSIEKDDPSTLPYDSKAFTKLPLHSMAAGDHSPRECFGRKWKIPPSHSWRYAQDGFNRLLKANRIQPDKAALRTVYYHDDYPASEIDNAWIDTGPEISKVYVVQTSTNIIQRCILMATDPGDLVLDPTCGSGTTAYVAEQWGRRWITMDTSRVALALARARIMGARFPWYMLADSTEGRAKEAEITQTEPSSQSVYSNIRHGFVYQRVPHITLKSIADNAEIDVIWDNFQALLEPLREQLNSMLGQQWEEWEIPREAEEQWPAEARSVHEQWWRNRIARQKDIDASIAEKADYEYLYDKPYESRQKVRVAGPFTVESVSPHRILDVNENDQPVDNTTKAHAGNGTSTDYVGIILENLKTAGVQQAHKEDRIIFASLIPWSGDLICAEGQYIEGNAGEHDGNSGKQKRAGIFIGPEFGTVSRVDLVKAAREAGEADFDVLIACAFSYDAHSTDFHKLGRIPVLKARMNADLHMATDLKNSKGNLFVIFGEPDISILDADDGQIQVKINGVDVFHPQTGEVRSDGPEGIACWFIDTDYNEESFFVRQAYFLGARDPYKALKTTLKTEINQDAWATLLSDTSRPFSKPQSGRIAIKVINHLGDEVMKVFRLDQESA